MDTPPGPPSAPDTPKQGLSTGAKALIGCVVAIPILICLIGIAASVGIPAFLRYVASAKAEEAEMQLDQLRDSWQRACLAGNVVQTAGPVPLSPSADKVVADFSSDPGFARMGFEPGRAVRFSYAVEPGAGIARLVARGDLDRDGVLSERVISCTFDCECGALAVDRRTALE